MRALSLGLGAVSRLLLGIWFLLWGAVLLFHLPVLPIVVGIGAFFLGVFILVGV